MSFLIYEFKQIHNIEILVTFFEQNITAILLSIQ